MQDLFGDVPPPAPVQRAPRPRPAAPARGTWSWFFALRPDAGEGACIDAFAAQLLARHPVRGGRIGPDRLHVSLDAVGMDPEPRIVQAALRAADTVRVGAFDVRFDAVETFSRSNQAVVLLGTEGLEAVRALRTTLACALADEGFKPLHGYHPHMTLGYDPTPPLPRTPVDPVGFRAGTFALVKSLQGFSRHEVVRTWPLAG